jgi:hypothetical protein
MLSGRTPSAKILQNQYGVIPALNGLFMLKELA